MVRYINKKVSQIKIAKGNKKEEDAMQRGKKNTKRSDGANTGGEENEVKQDR